jgi:predicted DNA binding protein
MFNGKAIIFFQYLRNMASLIELTLDLKSYNPFSSFFSPGNKDLFIDRIINYDSKRIVYIATLRKGDFVEELGRADRISKRLLEMYGILKFEILDKDASLKIYRVLVNQKLPTIATKLLKKHGGGMFLSPPMALTEDGLRINIIVMKGFLSGVRKFLDESGLDYRILRTKNLTAGYPELSYREKFILEYALESGYFDVPRRKKTEEICNALGTSKSTFSRAIRNAERKGGMLLLRGHSYQSNESTFGNRLSSSSR